MKKKIFSISVLLTIIFLLIQGRQIFSQSFIQLSDKDKIELAIDHIRKGIQQQKAYKILEVAQESVKVKERLLNKDELKSSLENLFSTSNKRIFYQQKPPNSILKNFWDFDISDIHLNISGDNCIVNCNLYLWAAKPDKKDTSQIVGRRISERMVFKKMEKVWVLTEVNNLLEFLEKIGEIQVPETKETKIDN